MQDLPPLEDPKPPLPDDPKPFDDPNPPFDELNPFTAPSPDDPKPLPLKPVNLSKIILQLFLAVTIAPQLLS